ncbi:3'-5' exonuclease [Enterobacter asburiae]|uniref:3'-5' exonuclease n=1 Tax=Enterobacter asburiae TaxID=61645 RepID=UPI003F577A58
MKNDDLAALRAAAIAEDSCFTKGRLRDEFRMKPAPGTEPVRWYKTPYGGRYGVYRIADCVPMREKSPPTEKQRLSGLRLSVLSRQNSTAGRLAHKAHTWLSQAPLFLDTETTGLGDNAEALEIGLTDTSGRVVFETRLKPTVAIEPQAVAVHGIDESALNGEPSWPGIAQELRHTIGLRPLIIFNAAFDTRILKQTAAAYGDPAEWLDVLTVHCAMELAADYFGATNRYGTISLASAASQAELTWDDRAHSAIVDARMTARVVNFIAAHYLQLLQEQERLSGSCG